MAEVSIITTGIKGLQRLAVRTRRRVRKLQAERDMLLQDPAQQIVERIKDEVQLDTVSGYSHVQTGNLLANTRAEVKVINNNRSEVLIGYFVPYGGYLEDGTRPHTPPFSNIQDWATAKGIGPAAFPIWQSIREKGTRSYPILARVWRANRNNYRNKVNRRVRNIFRK